MRPYLILDVFTDTPLEGNPLAVFTEGDGLPGETMQRIAREMNLSETVFVLPPGPDGDARIRIFTPAAELPFAGHPTLGAAFVLCGQRGLDAIVLETGAGPVRVEFAAGPPSPPGHPSPLGYSSPLGHPSPPGYPSALGYPSLPGHPFLPHPPALPGRMGQPVSSWEPYERAADLLAALGVTASQLPVEAYRNGPRHVYVALDSEDAVARLEPDQVALGKLPGIGVNCFAGQGARWKNRNFGPALGIAEDPATGSAAGPLAVHLARHGWISFGDQIEIRQGAEIGRPSLLYATAFGDASQVTRVEVAGSAVVVGRGEFLA